MRDPELIGSAEDCLQIEQALDWQWGGGLVWGVRWRRWMRRRGWMGRRCIDQTVG
jgi:hypothetical protein